jgi:hypothetical protein
MPHNTVMKGDDGFFGYDRVVLNGKMEDRIKIKKTPELILDLKPFWNEAREAEIEFRIKLSEIESRMYEKTRIEGIEFFFCDNAIVGIGNFERTMELIHDADLD